MLTRPTTLLPCCLLFVACCSAQRSPEAPSIEAVKPAAVAEPIAEYVVEVFEDRRGILWFGTVNAGVARYDGKTLTYLTEDDGLCGNTIASIAEDEGGALWFGGHAGACRYDPSAPLPPGGQAFTRFFDTEAWVRSDRRGDVWVSTHDAVHRFDGNAMVPFEVPRGSERPAVYSIAPGRISFELEDSRGNLWFRTDGLGAYRYDGKGFQQFTKQDGLCSNTVWSIVEDRQGRIWLGCVQAFQPQATGDGGVCMLEGGRCTSFPEMKGLTGNDIYTLYPDRSGNLWIGATGVGVLRHDGETFTLFDATDRPDLNGGFGLQAMLEDRHGTLWFGFSGGLFRFDGKRLVHVGRTATHADATRGVFGLQ